MTPAEAPSPEVLVERVKMALAEAGWPETHVFVDTSGRPTAFVGDVPAAAMWMAWKCVRVPAACWACFWPNSENMGRDDACAAGDCQAGPDEPRRPPRELLLRREP